MISFGAVESGRTRKTTSTNVTRSDSGDPKMFLIIDRTLWLSYVEAVISLIGNGFNTGNLLYVLRVPDGLLVNAHLGLTVMKYRNCMTYLVFFFSFILKWCINLQQFSPPPPPSLARTSSLYYLLQLLPPSTSSQYYFLRI